MKTAICPGSFDPVTLGHLDIIERAAGLFDQVTVLVMQNSAKQDGLFTVEERCRLIRRCLHAENIQIDTYDGLLVDYAKQTGAAAVVKGLRALSDFEYEFQQALTNKKPVSATGNGVSHRQGGKYVFILQYGEGSVPPGRGYFRLCAQRNFR